MKKTILRLVRLIFGLFLYALGIVITIKANIGYSPWDAFHSGISNTIDITMGIASIMTGLVIIMIAAIMGEKIGIGTILNMFLIGIFFDMINNSYLIPTTDNFIIGIGSMMIGLFVIAFASYFYIGSGFGAGPRDSLMVSLSRKTKFPIGVCRSAIEVFVVIIGYFLGGMVGIGTVLATFAIGICVQIVFGILKFDVTKVKHETLKDTYLALFFNENI
ncbi:MAG: hypothetical protein JJE49_03670 [Peptostreptococcaceae bacterium]|nr:hypothetical protein [Peptostreptococcaceae bacterium]